MWVFRQCLGLVWVLVCSTITSSWSLPLAESPFIEEYAPKRVLPSVKLKSSGSRKCDSCIFRYSDVNYPDSSFFHVHIPKTGGTTFFNCLKCWDVPSVTVASRYGCNTLNISQVQENAKAKHMISCEVSHNTLNNFVQTLGTPQLKILTFIRRPIDHVMSAFLHRKSHNSRHDACTSFDAIFRSIAASQSRDPVTRRSQKCYHYDITNMQTSALTLSSSGPNLAAAVAFISKSVFFLGITEYFRASLCLLAYQLGQLEMHRGLCDCSLMHDVAIKHSNALRNESFATLTHDELSIDMMKTLESEYINLDNALYHVALQVFLQRVVIAERESGTQLLCAASDGVEVSTLKANVLNPDWYNHA